MTRLVTDPNYWKRSEYAVCNGPGCQERAIVELYNDAEPDLTSSPMCALCWSFFAILECAITYGMDEEKLTDAIMSKTVSECPVSAERINRIRNLDVLAEAIRDMRDSTE